MSSEEPRALWRCPSGLRLQSHPGRRLVVASRATYVFYWAYLDSYIRRSVQSWPYTERGLMVSIGAVAEGKDDDRRRKRAPPPTTSTSPPSHHVSNADPCRALFFHKRPSSLRAIVSGPLILFLFAPSLDLGSAVLSI